MAQLLVEAGANVNAINSFNETPLDTATFYEMRFKIDGHYNAARYCQEVARFLGQSGAGRKQDGQSEPWAVVTRQAGQVNEFEIQKDGRDEGLPLVEAAKFEPESFFNNFWQFSSFDSNIFLFGSIGFQAPRMAYPAALQQVAGFGVKKWRYQWTPCNWGGKLMICTSTMATLCGIWFRT